MDWKGFALRMVWEAVQNVPLICGCLLAVSLARQDRWPAAAATIAASAIVAAIIIWITEPLIFRGHRETRRAVMGNMLTFSIVMLAGTVYLSASWSSWVTDLLVGCVLAIVLAAGQEFAAKERFGIVRSVALGLSGAGSLLLIRFTIDRSVLLAMLVANVWFTLIMGLYKEIRIMTGWIPATARQAGHGEEPTGNAS
ncbi:MAG: hypothetical protein JXA93_12185 [Anaerolineae bacterium]|nr:hypothetical protein [Anaerolineae bacterium]